MGLTPLEGLIGGTRSGTIDPTAVFHAISSPGEDAGLEGMSVTKAEMLLNKYVPTSTTLTISENQVFKL
jgi:acetate kinase